MTPGPAVAQQLGPMGINMGKVISDVNTATADFKGMKVPVELDINEETKEFTINALSPPTAELLKKEMGYDKGSDDKKKDKVANASIETIIKVAKIKHPYMLEKEFKSAVKSILGTCTSIGILAENKEANEIIEEVASGKYDKEINEKLTEPSPEKIKKLQVYFDQVKAKQEAAHKAEEEAAAEAEKAKEEAAAAEAAEGAEGAPAAEGAEAAPTEGAEGAEVPAEEASEAESK